MSRASVSLLLVQIPLSARLLYRARCYRRWQQAVNVLQGYKPVAKGSKETPEGLRNKDALGLQSVSSLELPYDAVNPIALSEEGEQRGAQRADQLHLLSDGLANLSEKVDHVVVEGTGGWRSLMNDLRPLSEWVVQEQLPVVMVVGIRKVSTMRCSRRRRSPMTACR